MGMTCTVSTLVADVFFVLRYLAAFPSTIHWHYSKRIWLSQSSLK